MMAAAEADRDLVYYYFGDKRAKSLEKMKEILGGKELTVGRVYSLIDEYRGEIAHLDKNQLDEFGVAEFLAIKFNSH